jgi:hypothetical protein
MITRIIRSETARSHNPSGHPTYFFFLRSYLFLSSSQKKFVSRPSEAKQKYGIRTVLLFEALGADPPPPPLPLRIATAGKNHLNE